MLGDKFLSNKQLILDNLTLGNASPQSKKFSTMPFLRFGFRLGATPIPGDKLWSPWGTHPHYLNIFYLAIFEIWLPTESDTYTGG
jgi:hypothetical protein